MSSQKIVDKVLSSPLTPVFFANEEPLAGELVWTLSEWFARTRHWLESSYGTFWLKGEVSNLTRAASGHIYFVLKEGGAQIRCVFFKMYAMRCSIELKNGLQIEVLSQATLYEERGDLQLRVERVRAVGLGDLWQRFLALKSKLEVAGWFDPQHKKLLPLSPRRVGILTSLQAAALRDVVMTLHQRAPSIQMIIYPIPVQGEEAPLKIAAMIAKACLRQEVDVLILCRGGGSLEDLAAFNEECVAEAIFHATLPIISGVGHETDFTIADFVADVRASTPTAAAVLAVPDELVQHRRLHEVAQRLAKAMRHRLEREQLKLDSLTQQLRRPSERLKMDQQRLKHLAQRMVALRRRLLPEAALLQRRWERLQQCMKQQLGDRAARLSHYAVRHQAVDPYAPLARGYALLHSAAPELRTISSINEVKAGESLQISLHDGTIDVIVTSI